MSGQALENKTREEGEESDQIEWVIITKIECACVGEGVRGSRGVPWMRFGYRLGVFSLPLRRAMAGLAPRSVSLRDPLCLSFCPVGRCG